MNDTDIALTSTKTRRLILSLTDDQYQHLKNIKSTHNIPMSAYIRTLLRQDMEQTTYSITKDYHQRLTITQVYQKKQHQQQPSNPQWQSINDELAPILEQRRRRQDAHAYTHP